MGLKEVYQQKIETQLTDWESTVQEYSIKIKELKAKAETLEGQAKLECHERLGVLEDKIKGLQTKLESGKHEYEKVKAASEEAWEDVKVGTEQAWDNVKSGVESGWSSLKEAMDKATSKLK